MDIPNDPTQYRKAAEQGSSIAQFKLATMYDKGEGVRKDLVQAAYWYRRAAEQGHAHAQFCLGILYMGGQDIPQDAEQVAFWIRKAAAQGHADAQNMLGFANTMVEVAQMKFSVGTWDEMFGERITIEVPDHNGRLVQRSVTKKWFSRMQETGRIGRASMSSIRVHMLHPAGHRTLEWVIGEDVKPELVDQFQDPPTGICTL